MAYLKNEGVREKDYTSLIGRFVIFCHVAFGGKGRGNWKGNIWREKVRGGGGGGVQSFI